VVTELPRKVQITYSRYKR